MSEFKTVKSINEAHRLLRAGKPLHPLVSIIRHTDEMNLEFGDVRFASELFAIILKEDIHGSLAYGRNRYDFEEGTILFVAPGQITTAVDGKRDPKGWTLVFHPDLIRSSELAYKIDSYSFFEYKVNEALHLSDREKQNLTELVLKIESEINQDLDTHSQELIVANLELILKYCARYYDRQFYTRSNFNRDISVQFHYILKNYFDTKNQLEKGLPSVRYCAEKLNISANYLGDLLKKETGKNAQDHIHSFVIEKAKNMLLNSNGTISQVAFQLGFEYSQHFSRLFKAKTGLTPKEYRKLN